jgi:hypothetical protein
MGDDVADDGAAATLSIRLMVDSERKERLLLLVDLLARCFEKLSFACLGLPEPNIFAFLYRASCSSLVRWIRKEQ